MTDSKRRRGLAAVSALLGGVLVLSACSDDGDKKAGAGSSESSQAQEVDKAAAEDASEAQIAIKPKNGATNASI
ncbi:hypothetical protein G3M55_10220, partial [Streptomyces sp. SID8455]|nr:hypothetical protein [Streptomyces sp. SID8455]